MEEVEGGTEQEKEEDDDTYNILTSCWQEDVELFETPAEYHFPEQRLALAVVLKGLSDYQEWFPRYKSEKVKAWFFTSNDIEEEGSFMFYMNIAFVHLPREGIIDRSNKIREYLLTLEGAMV